MSVSPPEQPVVLRGPHRPDLLRDECLADILSATAARVPKHAALIWGQQVVSYEELDRAAKKIGAALRNHGATPGTIVGLLLPRGADLLIAQAGITNSGAAWLPFDADTPLDRVQTCLHDAKAVALVSCRECLPRLAKLPVPVLAVEDLLARGGPHGSAAVSDREPSPVRGPSPQDIRIAGQEVSDMRAPGPTDPAYVIYTSGSTGQPKGIVIPQRGICHFIRSENELLGVRGDDKVFQGFSVAFDMSFEEIWIPYLVGATLWIAPAGVANDPELLARTLTQEQITVLHAVPTMMGLVDDPLPTVRLINLGGEACPEGLAARLARPGRKLFNTYGPTEASVSASAAELKPGVPLSIGMPLPNCGLLVVDPQRRPLPAGQTGELCIFGPGLARGYLGNPELTAERFIANPLAASDAEQRMYLTGDLAKIDPGGPVYCLGRADNQVKIRGFRVELEEINAALAAQPGVAAAAALVRPLGETEEVVAFIVPAGNGPIEASSLRQALARRLPSYMVPAHFEVVAALPRLTSGKVDLKSLRAVPLAVSERNDGQQAEPRDEDEAALFAAIRKLFPGREFRCESDFFDDLGGHSLLAARLVSHLRSDQRYATLSVQAVYRERRLAAIAQAMARSRKQPAQGASQPRVRVPSSRRVLCGICQSAVIPFFIVLHMADWLAPFFVYHYFTGDEGDSIPLAVAYALATFTAAQALNFAVAVLGKRVIAGRLQPGRYPLWGVTYFRWWLGCRFQEMPDLYLLAATPWMPLYLRALGARIGRNVMIDTVTISAPGLLRIDDGACIGAYVNIENARVEGGLLHVGPVHVMQGAVVDSYSVLENDTVIGREAKLCGLSALAAGRAIPDGETWDGAPARRSNQRREPLPPHPTIGPIRYWARAMLFALTAILVSALFFLPTFPAFMLIDWLDMRTWSVFDAELHPLVGFWVFFLLAIPASALLVALTMALAAGLLRWGLPRQTAGRFSIYSLAFWRKKTVNMILDNSLRSLHGLYASVYAPIWLRALGVKVGRHAEVSTAEGLVPELLTLGDDCFIADGVMLGDEEQRDGWMVLKPTRVGNRSFVGNGAYVPDGSTLPDDVLIGVQSRAPANEQLKSGQTWVGSPPLLLPAREQLTGFPESLTFRPALMRRLGRGFIEALRLVLPLAAVIATGYLLVILVVPLAAEQGWGLQVALALGTAGCAYGIGSFLFVAALKWILVGRYRPRAAPMWTPFVWLSEAVTNLYESLAVPNALNMLRGTPMLPWALRLLGAHIGRGVFMNTTDLTEFDCVHIGDEAELNAWCGPQTHLFEDRVMKIGRVDIGPRVTVGARSTILYDAAVGEGACLGPLTLVAKGETLPAGTRWEGSPASPVCGGAHV